MKLKPILTAFALAALVQPALAESVFTQNEKGEVTHYNGIALPPIQTVEETRAQAQKEIAAKKACEAQQAEQPATRHSSPATSPQEVFYTGKPYLEETGQYLFFFRHYDPELARWTTADPSGFPDGANHVAYMAVPTSEIDFLGLDSILAGELVWVQAAIEGFRSLGWTAAVRRAEWSLTNGGDETAPQNEIDALFAASQFSQKLNNNYFESIFVANGKSAFDYSGQYPVTNYGVKNGVSTNDLAAAYGNMGGEASGQFSRQDQGNKILWSIDVTFSFSDLYDFGGSDPFSSAFRRLQEAGLTSIYATSGTYSKTFSGVLE